MNIHDLFGRWEVFLLAILVVVLAVGGLSSEYFLTESNISVAMAGAMPTALIALAMMLVIVTGEIDISVGSLVGLCAATMGAGIEQGWSIGIVILAGLLAGAAAGALNGAMVAYGRVPSLVVTLGTLALFRGIAQVILEERGISTFPDWYQQLGFGTVPSTPFPWSAVPFVVLLATFVVFLHGTHWGRNLYAIGNNRVAAFYSGIETRRVIFGTFVTSGLMCAIAAVVLTGYLASTRSDTATGLELYVITAVVLGGVNIFGGSGKLTGVVIAVFVLAFVQNVLGLAGVAPERQQVVTGAVLIVSLIVFGGSGRFRHYVQSLRFRTLAAPPSIEHRQAHQE